MLSGSRGRPEDCVARSSNVIGLPGAVGVAHVGAQGPRDRDVELRLAAIGHVGQQDPGEGLVMEPISKTESPSRGLHVRSGIAVSRHRRRAVRLDRCDDQAAGLLCVDKRIDRGGDLGVASAVGRGGDANCQDECGTGQPSHQFSLVSGRWKAHHRNVVYCPP